MVRVRNEVRSLGPGWSEPLRWYATAVRKMRARPLSDPTSWWFIAAIHGIHPQVWSEFGMIDADEPLPTASVWQRYWNQCQHQSWYFLPWHRGYVAAFEEIAREAIVAAGGPEDWALPYWDYSDSTRADARTLPEVFAVPELPDGSANPLWVERRFGDGNVPLVVDERFVSLRALRDTEFTGGASDIPPGFGGPRTLFHHGPESQTTNGSLESLPHNILHSALGGSAPGRDPNDWRNVGLMSMPITAALDPIFWLHHSNIDRLWSLWQQSNADPSDPTWLDGPADRPFLMPTSDGGEWAFTARDVLDTSTPRLDYVYGEAAVVPDATISRRSLRLRALDEWRQPATRRPADEGDAMAESRDPELIGASAPNLRVVGETDAAVRLDTSRTTPLRRSVQRRAVADAMVAPEPPRVFLKLEGIRGTCDAAIYHVYIDVPVGEDPAGHDDRLAGTLSLFGVSAASDPDGPEAGNGINQVLEITLIVDALSLSGDDLATLDVRFVPANRSVEAADFAISRVSVFMLQP